MTTGHTVRLAAPQDIRSLPPIERAASEMYKELRAELELRFGALDSVTPIPELEQAQRAGTLWVAADPADAPVGFALVRLVDGAAYLAEMDVHPAHGRGGVGSALLARVCDWAREAGIPAVTLSSFRDVPWNGPFYARRGFRVLDAGELSPGLAEVARLEREKGLRMDRRVVMRYATGAG